MTMVGRDKVKKDQMMLGTLLNQFKRGQINKNHPLQRKPDQWTDEAKSGLAATIIKGEDIDSIKICEQIVSSTEFILWLIDGLQRLTVLESFKNNAFEIKKSLEMPIMYYQGVDENGKVGVIKYDLRGKKYKDLPDELKEKFDSYAVDIVKHLDCTDEEIAYHIARYNRQTSMNVNQKNILAAWKIAPEIKNLTNNRFFKDCGNYNPKEDTKEVFNRIVCESIMTMFHLDNWKKAKQMSIYLNDNATKEEFDTFESELNRLYKIIDQDTVGQLFNAKNSFIWFAAFHKFTEFGIEDIRFTDFLEEFQRTLHSKTFAEYENESFDTYDGNKGTKDKKVVNAKLDMIEQLMKEYLHITDATEDKNETICNKEESHSETDEESSEVENKNENVLIKTENNKVANEDMLEQNTGSPDVLDFVKTTVGDDIEIEDIEEYQEFVDAYVRIDSTLYQNCTAALIALTAYAYRLDKDEEFAEWLERYQRNKREFAPSQIVNYKYMKRDLDNFLKFTENKKKENINHV
jgi:hypothetical protein|nr:MAG TPA: Protein of unknown function DUF262 [Caudoviricetes sp.]